MRTEFEKVQTASAGGSRLIGMARLAAVVLFVAVVPVFLVASNVRWVINAPLLYSYGFDKYDIPARTGIERGELLSAAEQIRSYFNGGEEFLTVSVRVNGVSVRNLYNDREVLHMRDVKGLVRGMYRIQEVTGIYLGAFILLGLLAWRRQFGNRLLRYTAYGGVLTLVLIVVVGLASLVGFDRLFLAFHLVSFSNDLWQLDPRTDYLLMMFPAGFFFDATMWIAGATVAQALLLTVSRAVMAWRGRRVHQGRLRAQDQRVGRRSS